MDSFFPWGFIFLFIVIAIGLGVLAWYQAEQRRKRLREWADRNGWRFSAEKDHSLDSKHPDFAGLHQGSNRYAYNRVFGDYKGRQMLAFDYHYETYSTDSKGRRQTHHHHFSGIILRAGVPLQPLKIREENFFDKIGSFFGFDDINFESIEFSKTFHVSSPDRRWAYDVIHQETMEYLLQSPRFTLEFDHGYVLAYRNSTMEPKKFEEAMAVAAGVLDRLPRSLVQEINDRR